MVLADLGNTIAKAISKLNNSGSKIDEKAFQQLLNEITRALLASDVSMELIQQLNANIKQSVSLQDLPDTFDVRRVIEKAVIQELTNLLDGGRSQREEGNTTTAGGGGGDNHKSKKIPQHKRRQNTRGGGGRRKRESGGPFHLAKKESRVIMFVGLQGSGKTTTCTKLAYYYRTRGWKVGLICADTFRAGAFDQLRQNATKAKIPYYGKRDESDPVVIARQGVELFKKKKFELIIVDTSGRHKQEESLFFEMEAISNEITPDHTIFVLDSTIGQAASMQAKAFSERVDVGSVIVTKLDGHAKGGGALSAVSATKAPISFIGVGEHINELERFNCHRFVKRILGKGDLDTLVERVKEHKLDDQKELMHNIKKGKFTLAMMRDQFQNILKMGSFGQIMQMIPGLNNLPKESEKQSQKRLQAFLTLMDSMTQEELEASDISIIETSISRRQRICRGSGIHPSYINELVAVYKPFSAAAGKMKKLPFGKNGELPKNPQQMGKLASMMPSGFLKQIGGQQGFMNLMQKFQGAENGAGGGGDPMANMANMQNAMKSMGKYGKLMRNSRRRK